MPLKTLDIRQTQAVTMKTQRTKELSLGSPCVVALGSFQATVQEREVQGSNAALS